MPNFLLAFWMHVGHTDSLIQKLKQLVSIAHFEARNTAFEKVVFKSKIYLGAWIAEWSSHSPTMNIVCNALGQEVNPWWQPFFFGSSITSTLRKTFRKNGVKRKQKEQLLILLFVNLLLHLCCLWKLLKITKVENKIIFF